MTIQTFAALVALSAPFAASTEPSITPKLVQVFECTESEGRSLGDLGYLAIFEPDAYAADRWMLGFSEADGRIRFRDFGGAPTGLYLHQGSSAVLTDTRGEYQLSISGQSRDAFGATAQNLRAGGIRALQCDRIDVPGLPEVASQAAQRAQAEWARIDQIQDPDTLAELKALLKLLERRFGESRAAIDESETPFPFPVLKLQIEQRWGWLEPKAVRVDDFTRASRHVRRVKEGPIARGFAKFARTELTRAERFQCNGKWFTAEAFAWVLQDGSTFTYTPVQECD